MYKICIVTGTRAEYGLLKPLIKLVDESDKAELVLAVTGTHLSKRFGHTLDMIENDGYPIAARIDLGLDKEKKSYVTDFMAVAVAEFGRFFAENRPDIVILLGDRYETLMVATAAMMHKIPIAHLHGGEITEGAVDDAIRHSISKMSYLHFTSTEVHRKRILQLGEAPDRVYTVGAPGVENVLNLKCMEDDELWNSLGKIFDTNRPLAVLTYHPETLGKIHAAEQVEEILAFIDRHPELQVIFTGANADAEGEIINGRLKEYAENNSDRCSFFMSLGQLRYFSLLRRCSLVIGNSSSGVIEVPSFGIPTINIGDRQRGRERAESVVDCVCEREAIENAYKLVMSDEFRAEHKEIKNPYEGDNTSERIFNIIRGYLDNGIDIQKKFVDIV